MVLYLKSLFKVYFVLLLLLPLLDHLIWVRRVLARKTKDQERTPGPHVGMGEGWLSQCQVANTYYRRQSSSPTYLSIWFLFLLDCFSKDHLWTGKSSILMSSFLQHLAFSGAIWYYWWCSGNSWRVISGRSSLMAKLTPPPSPLQTFNLSRVSSEFLWACIPEDRFFFFWFN